MTFVGGLFSFFFQAFSRSAESRWGHSCMWVCLSVVRKEGLYVCFCRWNTTFIASIPEKRTYQELISLQVLVAVFVVACCKHGKSVDELSTECSGRFQKGWALLCHCHHRLTQCVDVFSLDAECDIASSNDVYVYLETPMNMVAYKRPTIVGFTLDIEAFESSVEAYDERTFLHPEAFLYVTLHLINLSVLLCIMYIIILSMLFSSYQFLCLLPALINALFNIVDLCMRRIF